ncbi:MAG: ring-cleaving dioxygenase, partial [Thermomicrobiaceae bacterium]|nr:ring-cleaving dioxygenase [Thermomicrobiaceae bacterium]
VKQTVNFDMPDTYHLYYGDELGRPGTIITYFPWPRVPRGRRGAGQIAAISFAIPEASVDYWLDRLARHGVAARGPAARLDERVIELADPDGIPLELVARAEAEREPGWAGGPVLPEHAIRGLHGVTLLETRPEATARLLTEELGLRPAGKEGARQRFVAPSPGPGRVVDVVSRPEELPGFEGTGTVHHVAWRVPDEEAQAAWRERLLGLALHVTPVLDRNYFRSIYFREPGGVLFEIATDGPGFTVDEPPERLGTHLKLPPWLEPEREAVERILPPLQPSPSRV